MPTRETVPTISRGFCFDGRVLVAACRALDDGWERIGWGGGGDDDDDAAPSVVSGTTALGSAGKVLRAASRGGLESRLVGFEDAGSGASGTTASSDTVEGRLVRLLCIDSCPEN